jgi:uncharacterized protein
MLTLMTPTLEAQRELDAWRAQKDQEMRGADSPLAYLGMREIAPGHNTVGSGADDVLRFSSPGLPERCLDLFLQGQGVHLSALIPMVALNGQPVEQADLTPGDRIAFGPLDMVYRGRPGFQVYDRARPERLNYEGLHYLPIDPRYRVSATFVPAEAGRSLTLQTTQGQQRVLPLKGVLHFRLQGHEVTLDGFELGERADLFVVFRDATSGRETYGAGRFLWVKAPVDGKTVVDFNLAWNPLCAYSDGFNCPLAPPENRLTLPIPVGEAPYHH